MQTDAKFVFSRNHFAPGSERLKQTNQWQHQKTQNFKLSGNFIAISLGSKQTHGYNREVTK